MSSTQRRPSADLTGSVEYPETQDEFHVPRWLRDGSRRGEPNPADDAEATEAEASGAQVNDAQAKGGQVNDAQLNGAQNPDEPRGGEHE